MFWHVYTRACACRELERVVLATDDENIFAAAEALDVPVVMTRSDHPSGSDRVLEAAMLLGIQDHCVVVNIQGDEPALEPKMLNELISAFAFSETRVSTLVREIPPAEAENPDVVTVTFSGSGRALYFSRSLIPYPREGVLDRVFEHVGMYAYRLEALKKFVSLGPSRLEKVECLEQLRLLENDIPIQIVTTTHKSMDVDRPEDLEAVTEFLKRKTQKLTGAD